MDVIAVLAVAVSWVAGWWIGRHWVRVRHERHDLHTLRKNERIRRQLRRGK